MEGFHAHLFRTSCQRFFCARFWRQSASAQQSKKADSEAAAKAQSHSNYKLFNPETIAKPTGYSHVAEINGGKIVYIAGQVALDRSGIWWARMISVRRCSRYSRI